MANAMSGSSILNIANEIRELLGRGVDVANLTVGDFSPSEFPIPTRLTQELLSAVGEGDTNYPPSAGVWDLRDAVRNYIRRTQGLDYPLEGVAIVSGGRPTLYSTFRLLTDPGDKVVFPVPSWNNHNYQDTSQVRSISVQCHREDAFQPTIDILRPHLEDARLFVLNSPQNPSGGVMPRQRIAEFGEYLVQENERRKNIGAPPLYLLFDQIYQSLVFEGHEHVSPVEVVPACAPYVIHADGISKGFAATGLRCGWAFGPPPVIEKVVALGTHCGTWAPKPVQQATAQFLRDSTAVDSWNREMIQSVRERLECLSEVMGDLKNAGHPIDSIDPQGAIYLSVRFGLKDYVTKDGKELTNNEDIRSWLLQECSFALVPFSAFGVEPNQEDGWFRASIGAVSCDDLKAAGPRLLQALDSLTPPKN